MVPAFLARASPPGWATRGCTEPRRQFLPNAARESRILDGGEDNIVREQTTEFVLTIGNTAERTVNAVDCSVLAVKPDAFAAPVKNEEHRDSNRQTQSVFPATPLKPAPSCDSRRVCSHFVDH